MNEHTAKAFDTDLQDLTRKVSEMGGLAEREIADSIQALTRRDLDLAMRGQFELGLRLFSSRRTHREQRKEECQQKAKHDGVSLNVSGSLVWCSATK